MKFLTLIALLLLSVPAQAQANEFTGLWLTENQRSAIDIRECDQGLCGRIHWIVEGGMAYDSKNPDETLRDRPMCGLPILWGFQQTGAKEWSQGRIYKADEGDTYHATLQLLPTGKLLVRGYVGMPLFGKSQTWTKVDAGSYPACREP